MSEMTLPRNGDDYLTRVNINDYPFNHPESNNHLYDAINIGVPLSHIDGIAIVHRVLRRFLEQW